MSRTNRNSRRIRRSMLMLEQCEDRVLLATILGTAQSFAVLGASTVTSTGATAIVGNVGVSPGTAITGFPPGVISGGAIHAGDALASQAHADLVAAYGAIAGEASPPANALTGQDLGGLTLLPGVYHFATSAALSGILTLDAQGNPDARFDFQIGTTLITGSGSAVHLINGALSDNVYFQVGTSATLGTNTAFRGNILADQSVTLTTGASMLEGRALALVGAVTMDTNQASAAETDLSVTKTTSVGTVLAGANVSYTVTVANAGPNAAQTVALSDSVPANTTFVSDTQISGPAFNLSTPAQGGTGTITGTIAALASGASASFTVVVLVSPSTTDGTTIANTASVAAATSDPNLANNSATVTNLTAAQADLSATNSAQAGTVFAGDTIAYTITLSNAGPSDAQNVGATNFPPAHTTFVSEAQTSGPPFGAGLPGSTDVAHIDTLAAGASATFTFVVQVLPGTPAGTTITNTTTINSDTSDPNLANNIATVTTLTATQADVSVTNAVAAGPVLPGDSLTYTITVANAGPSDAQTVALSDVVPANTTFFSEFQNAGPAFDVTSPAVGGTGTINGTVATLPAGQSAIFTVVVVVAQGTPDGTTITNTANVAAATSDPDLTNNTATVTTGSPVGTGADLSVTTTRSASTVIAGSAASVTVTIANAGPEDALNVAASGMVPADTTFVTITQISGPAFNASIPPQGGTGTITATIATLASGVSASFIVVFQVAPSTPAGTVISSTVSVNSTTTDPNLANNTATASSLTVTQADMEVTKTAADNIVDAGNTIAYTITLSNTGPSDAQNVGATDLAPANTVFVSEAQLSGPPFSAGLPGSTDVAHIDTMPAGASGIFSVVFQVLPGTPAGTTITNTASVTSDTADPDTSDNSATVMTLTGTQADLSLTKAIANGPVIAGRTVAYTITIANAGPSDARTVALSDVVPANTTFVSDTQTSGPSFNLTSPAAGGTGTINGTIAALASGASATFTVVVLVSPSLPAGSTIGNTANVAAATTDPNPANNSATITALSATQADVSVTKTIAAGAVFPGDNIAYTITVANSGPSDAQTVSWTDLVPASTTLVSDAQSSGPAFALTSPAVGRSGTINGAIATLASGTSASFTVMVMVAPSAPVGSTIGNTAVAAADTTDPNLVNNSQTVTTTVMSLTPILPSPSVVNVQRFGFHAQPTVLVISFSMPLDAARALKAANYQIVTIGGPGRGGSLKGHVTRVAKVVYDPVSRTVTLHMAQRMDFHNFYRLTIKGTAAGGLMGTEGAPLDGAGTTTPGSNFVSVISPKSLAGPSIAAIRISRISQAHEPRVVHSRSASATKSSHRSYTPSSN